MISAGIIPVPHFYPFLGEWPRLPFTAQLSHLPNPERALAHACPGQTQLHRARSASKKGTWPFLPHSLRLTSSRRIRRHKHHYFETLVCVIFHAVLLPGWRQGPLPWTKHLFL